MSSNAESYTTLFFLGCKNSCIMQKNSNVYEVQLGTYRKRFSWEQYMDLSILFKFIFLNWVIEIFIDQKEKGISDFIVAY